MNASRRFNQTHLLCESVEGIDASSLLRTTRRSASNSFSPSSSTAIQADSSVELHSNATLQGQQVAINALQAFGKCVRVHDAVEGSKACFSSSLECRFVNGLVLNLVVGGFSIAVCGVFPAMSSPSTSPNTSLPPLSPSSSDAGTDDVIHTIEGVQTAVNRMKECILTVNTHCDHADPTTESTFVAKTQSDLDAATALSRQIAAFLDLQRQNASPDEKDRLKATQKDFVEAMKQLQQTQRMHARKREALVEYDLIQTSAVVTARDLERAKEDEAKIVHLAEATGEIRQVFKAVGAIVGEQTVAVHQVAAHTKEVTLQIGRAITEEEQAAYLRAQEMKKRCLVLLLLVIVVAAVATPLILTYYKPNLNLVFLDSLMASTATVESATLNTVEQAAAAVARMKECLSIVEDRCHAPDMTTEKQFVEQTQAPLDEATALSRQVANFLKHKHAKADVKAVQVDFVATMKRLLETQRMHTRKHEAVVEYDLIQSGTVSSDEFKAGRDVLEKELALAEEMGHLVHTVDQVHKVVHDQTAVIEHVKADIEAVSLEIGAAVTAEEQAAYLRWEKTKKQYLLALLVLMIVTAIVTPIVLTFAR
ncbi:hypothetical protein Ae201684P_006559 [Aphanomyces euteiches]|nr:hypothetical protein Ae201684P_006559 [Aphanomyces euteiches]KAH9157590.1 hypothetical protein AeRB84_000589 [Aphanomyces euteiches]